MLTGRSVAVPPMFAGKPRLIDRLTHGIRFFLLSPKTELDSIRRFWKNSSEVNNKTRSSGNFSADGLPSLGIAHGVSSVFVTAFAIFSYILNQKAENVNKNHADCILLHASEGFA